jgi:hypothetical protein
MMMVVMKPWQNKSHQTPNSVNDTVRLCCPAAVFPLFLAQNGTAAANLFPWRNEKTLFIIYVMAALLLIRTTAAPRFAAAHLPYLGFNGPNFGIALFRKEGTSGEKTLNSFSIHFH